MQEPDRLRAIAAATDFAIALDLAVDDAIVLNNSNTLTTRLLPCDVVARIRTDTSRIAYFEVDLAQRFAATESPMATLDRRFGSRIYERDEFTITLWTHYESRELAPGDYADALARMHAGMRRLDVATPHFTDRVAEGLDIVENPERSPRLNDADRMLLRDRLREVSRAISDRSPAEQVLHGEPHPGNVLNPATGPVFIDFETCCRGPVEFDLAHVPVAVSDLYPNVDAPLLQDCRHLVLAMVAAWRWDTDDAFPNGHQWGRDLIAALRAGPPYPTLDDMNPPAT